MNITLEVGNKLYAELAVEDSVWTDQESGMTFKNLTEGVNILFFSLYEIYDEEEEPEVRVMRTIYQVE